LLNFPRPVINRFIFLQLFENRLLYSPSIPLLTRVYIFSLSMAQACIGLKSNMWNTGYLCRWSWIRFMRENARQYAKPKVTSAAAGTTLNSVPNSICIKLLHRRIAQYVQSWATGQVALVRYSALQGFSLLHKVQTGSGVHQASYPNGCGGKHEAALNWTLTSI
jgi:hypothetical protein